MDKQETAYNYPDSTHKTKRRKKKWIIIGSIVLLLVVVRLVMPYFVLKYVNKVLAKSKTYPGHVRDINLALIRGAYVIRDIRIDKSDSLTGKRDSIPFFTSPAIDLSVEWKALFKGSVVGEITVDDPRVNFVKGKHKDENVKQDTSDFQDVLRDLMPLTINRFEIRNGEIHYLDPFSNPRVDVLLSNLDIVATNLRNTNDSSKALPAALKATADMYDGNLDLNVKFDVLQKQPTFDMNAKVTSVNMTKLNDFFKAYGNFDVKAGNFGLYTEFAAKDGKFNGYVKPMLKDLDIVQWNKEEGNVAQILWETVVGSVAEIFQNQSKEQLATKVPIKGTFEDPTTGLWNAIMYVLRNAFVYALQPSIDETIDIGKVEEVDTEKTMLQKIFGKKDKDKDKDEKSGDKKDSDKKDGDKKAGKEKRKRDSDRGEKEDESKSKAGRGW